MELSDFKEVKGKKPITKLDMYLHKGLDWVEHSRVDLDTLFEEIVSGWDCFSAEEKVEILYEFTNEYRSVCEDS